MPLSQQVKDAVDAMNNIDQALLMLYVLGVDDIAAAGTLGEAIMAERFSDVETPTNNQKAKAIKHEAKTHLRNIYVGYKREAAAIAAAQTAETDAEDDIVYAEVDPTQDD